MAEKPVILLSPGSVADPVRQARSSGEAEAAIGAGLARAGQGLAVAADRMIDFEARAAAKRQQLAEDAEIAGLHAKVSEGQAYWAKDIGERVRTAAPGDREMVPKFNEDFDKYANDLKAVAKTPGAENFLTKALAEQKSHFIEHADQAQVAVSAAYAKSTYDSALQSFSSALVTDPTGLKVAVTTHRDRLSSMVASGAIQQKDAPALLVSGEKQLAKSAALGDIRLDPAAAKESILAGEFDQWLDGTEKASLVGEAESRIRARESDARARRSEAEAQANRQKAANYDSLVDRILSGDPTKVPSRDEIVGMDLHGRDTAAAAELIEKAREKSVIDSFAQGIRPALEKLKGVLPGMDVLLATPDLRGNEMLAMLGKLDSMSDIPYRVQTRQRAEAKVAFEAEEDRQLKLLDLLSATKGRTLPMILAAAPKLSRDKLSEQLKGLASDEEKARILAEHQDEQKRIQEDRRTTSDKEALRLHQLRNEGKLAEVIAQGGGSIDLVKMARSTVSGEGYIRLIDKVGNDREKAEARQQVEADRKAAADEKKKMQIAESEAAGRVFLPPGDPARINSVQEAYALGKNGAYEPDVAARVAAIVRERDTDAGKTMAQATASLAQKTKGRLLMDLYAGKIRDDKDLVPHYGPGGLDNDGFSFLRGELTRLKAPAAKAEEKLLAGFEKAIRGTIAPMNSELGGIRDPIAETNMQTFMADFADEYAAARAANKSPRALLDPESPDYLGKTAKNYVRSLNEILPDVLGRLGGSPRPAASSAPGAASPSRKRPTVSLEDALRERD